MVSRYSSEDDQQSRGSHGADNHDRKRRRLSDSRDDAPDRSVDRHKDRDERRSRHERSDRNNDRETEKSHRHRSRSRSRDADSKSHRSKHHRSRSRDAHKDDSRSHRRHRSRSPRDRHSHKDDKDGTEDSKSHRSRKHSHRHGSRSRSPKPSKSSKSSKARSSSPFKRSRAPLPSQADSFNHQQAGGDPDVPEAERPNFGNTGLLAKASNRVAGTDIVLKYNEPSDARQPSAATQDWRLFIFKDKDGSDPSGGDDLLDTVPLASRSCWLIGRERSVVDLYVEHPSASKQHAVIQFRYVTKTSEFGEKKGKVKPYIIDLESGNGTVLNGERLAGRRFVEVRSGDVMQIGSSRREYVFVLPPKE